LSVKLIDVDVIDEIKRHKVIAVIRADNAEKALEFANGCIRGGIKLIEITFSFPGAEETISELSKKDGLHVGAGTLLDKEMGVRALEAGAEFLVSPHTDKDLIELAKQNGKPVIQGALTSSEIVNAQKLGVDMVKVFPAKQVGGPSYVKAIKEALPFIDIMTTGGVNIDNFTDYLSAGASAVGLSSAFLGEQGTIDADIIAENTMIIIDKLNNFENT